MLQLRLSREERDQKEAAEQDIEDLKQVHMLLHQQFGNPWHQTGNHSTQHSRQIQGRTRAIWAGSL